MDISSSSRKVIARWAKPTDRILITELLRHLRNGERICNKFGPEIWSQITAQVNKPSIGTNIPMLNILQVKNRYFALKKSWKDFTSLLKTDGFHWDRERGKIDAEKEVWAQYLKAHPRAGIFRQRPLDDFEELCELFGNTGQAVSATGAQGDEDVDEEAEDQGMDEEGGHSAEKTGATPLTYQDSPIPNVNGAQAGDLHLPARPAPAPVWGSSSLYSPSPRSQGNDSFNTADSRCPRHGYNGKALTEIAKVFTVQMDELITTIKSHHEMKAKQVPAQYLPYAEAVGKAVKLYQKGDISKTDFRLAISSLKHNPLECVAFWQMSDELRIDWIIERAKESEKCASNTKA